MTGGKDFRKNKDVLSYEPGTKIIIKSKSVNNMQENVPNAMEEKLGVRILDASGHVRGSV